MKIHFYEGYLRNRLKLCAELSVLPTADRKNTEEEILLAGYRRWGRDVVNHLYGAFAFAVRDDEKNEYFCARDPFGTESFYYFISCNVFLCSADLKTIVENPGYKKELDRDALQLYMTFGYPVGEKTLYRGIRKLMGGHALTLSGSGYRIEPYFTPCFAPDNTVSEEEWTTQIHRTLQEILDEDRQNFDLTGAVSFLSGGVDSSYLLAASAAPGACGIGFPESEYSETGPARKTAETLGADFHEITVTAENFLASIPRFVKATELPLADAAAVAFSIGCEHAAKETDLCLSGEGADEFFAGYNVYRRAEELYRRSDFTYYGCDGIMEQEQALALLKMAEKYPLDCLNRNVLSGKQDGDSLSRMLRADISLWLEGNILFGVNRSVKANGLNILLPYSDRRMFELSAHIPSGLKLKEGCDKYIFRKAAETVLPKEIAFRKKIGFSVPVRKWFGEERFRPEIETVLFSDVSSSFFDADILREYWNSFLAGDTLTFRIVYAAYIFLIWYGEEFEQSK